MLSDTVGFIRDLPHHLVASFRSTLEETVHCSLLLLVLDVADSHARMHLDTVSSTLDEIGAVTQPRLLVLNKIDLLDRDEALLPWLHRHPKAIPLSAGTGRGVDALCELVLEHLRGPVREIEITVPLSDGRAVSFLERRSTILNRRYGDDVLVVQVRIGRRQVDELLAQATSVRIDGGDPHDAIRVAWDEPS